MVTIRKKALNSGIVTFKKLMGRIGYGDVVVNSWDVYNKNCPTRLILNRIADKWTVLIIGSLTQDIKRFNELRREIDGISQKMLTQTLRGMERDGLINRKVYATVPPKVEYSLTDLGFSLTYLLEHIRNWSETNVEKVLQSQEGYDSIHNTI